MDIETDFEFFSIFDSLSFKLLNSRAYIVILIIIFYIYIICLKFLDSFRIIRSLVYFLHLKSYWSLIKLFDLESSIPDSCLSISFSRVPPLTIIS